MNKTVIVVILALVTAGFFVAAIEKNRKAAAAFSIENQARLAKVDALKGEMLHPVKMDGFWGYVDNTGKMRIPVQFATASIFSEGHAKISFKEMLSVKVKNKGTEEIEYFFRHRYGWIDSFGRVEIIPVYDNAGDFSEESAPAASVYYTEKGEFFSHPVTLTNSDGSEEKELEMESRYDFIDSGGKIVLHTEYTGALPFSEEKAAVSPFPENGDTEKRVWGYIEHSGTMVIQAQFTEARSFSEGMAAVKTVDTGLWGFINHDGAFIIKPTYADAQRFVDGVAVAKMGSDWGYIDRSGAWVLQAEFEMAGSFSDGLAAAKKKNELWGYIDKSGKYVIPPQYEGARAFRNGISAVKKDGKWGFIDKKGDFVIAPQFDDAL